MRKSIRVAVAAAALSLIGALPALAGSTGLESIHGLGREGGALCMSDHFHYGNGKSDTSKKDALAVATRAWSSFVQLEYGSDWSNFSRAHDRDVNCSATYGTFTCDVSARPCRSGGYATKSKGAKHRRHR